MDKFTRKELKTDKFRQEVAQSLEFFAEHRRQTLIYGGVALAVIVLAVGGYYFRKHRHQVRQQALTEALHLEEAVIGPPAGPDDPRVTFPTREDKERAVKKAFSDIVFKYSGTNEASVAQYHLGAMAADAGDLAEAQRYFKAAADSGDTPYTSTARFSLAQVYEGLGKLAEAEQVLRSLVENPTILVSKEQATLELARVLAKSKPAEARKLLEPLEKDKRAVISRNAATLLAEIPAQ